MPFTADGTVSQTATGETVIFTDLSNYAVEDKSTFSARTLSVYDYNGEQIDGSPFDFSFDDYPTDQITVTDELAECEAWLFVLELTSIDPQPGSTYTFTGLANLNVFAYILLYQLNQALASNRSLENNSNFTSSLANVLNELDNSINMTTYSNQGLVQFALQRIQRYIDNPQLFY